MSENKNVKQDLLDLANNLDSSEGVIIIKGINTGNSNELDVLYHKVNPLLAIPAILATASSVYETALSNMEFGLARGEVSKEYVEGMLESVQDMFSNFNSVIEDLFEESNERRSVALRGIANKEVDKEEN